MRATQKWMRAFIIGVLCSVAAQTINVCAQPNLYSETELNIPGSEEVENAIKIRTADGGDLVCASSKFPNTFTYFTYFIKLDSAGAIQWTKRFVLDCAFRQVVQCPDGGFVLSGEDNYNYTSYNLLKLDQQGNILYSKRIATSGHPTLSPPVMLVKANNNILLGASVVDSINYYWHLNVFEIDAQGNVLWSNVYHNQQYGTDIAAIDTFSNGDLMVLGSWTNPSYKQYPLMDRLSPTGTIIWSQKLFAPSADVKPYCMQKAGGDHFLISTTYSYPVPFGYVGGMTYLKINGAGNMVWSYRYEDYPVQLGDMVTMPNSGTCVIGGDMGGRTNLLRLDSSGNLLGSSCFKNRYLRTIDTLPGGYLSMCGINFLNKKIVLEVTSPEGESCSDSAYTFTKALFSTYPSADSGMYPIPTFSYNETYAYTSPVITMSVVCSTVDIDEAPPAENHFKCFIYGSLLHVNCDREIRSMDVYDASGRLVCSSSPQQNSAVIDLGNQPPGVYLVQANVNGEIVTDQFIKAD